MGRPSLGPGSGLASVYEAHLLDPSSPLGAAGMSLLLLCPPLVVVVVGQFLFPHCKNPWLLAGQGRPKAVLLLYQTGSTFFLARFS
jgi:hypothetical protein